MITIYLECKFSSLGDGSNPSVTSLTTKALVVSVVPRTTTRFIGLQSPTPLGGAVSDSKKLCTSESWLPQYGDFELDTVQTPCLVCTSLNFANSNVQLSPPRAQKQNGRNKKFETGMWFTCKGLTWHFDGDHPTLHIRWLYSVAILGLYTITS